MSYEDKLKLLDEQLHKAKHSLRKTMQWRLALNAVLIIGIVMLVVTVVRLMTR